jgi:hypothetical protein
MSFVGKCFLTENNGRVYYVCSKEPYGSTATCQSRGKSATRLEHHSVLCDVIETELEVEGVIVYV